VASSCNMTSHPPSNNSASHHRVLQAGRERSYRITGENNPANLAAKIYCSNDRDREHITVPEFSGDNELESTRIVLDGIPREGHLPLLMELRDFTRLQRLFRAAMAGRFGREFPLEKLILLTDATRSSVVTCPTPRWLREDRLSGQSLDADGLRTRTSEDRLCGRIRLRAGSRGRFWGQVRCWRRTGFYGRSLGVQEIDSLQIERDCGAGASRRGAVAVGRKFRACLSPAAEVEVPEWQQGQWEKQKETTGFGSPAGRITTDAIYRSGDARRSQCAASECGDMGPQFAQAYLW
jgi:hypothetical protein